MSETINNNGQIENLCKGCRVKNICLNTMWSTLCPCIACLVKVMCSQTCDDRIEFRNNQIMGKPIISRYL
jgi:hypothetical protein